MSLIHRLKTVVPTLVVAAGMWATGAGAQTTTDHMQAGGDADTHTGQVNSLRQAATQAGPVMVAPPEIPDARTLIPPSVIPNGVTHYHAVRVKGPGGDKQSLGQATILRDGDRILLETPEGRMALDFHNHFADLVNVVDNKLDTYPSHASTTKAGASVSATNGMRIDMSNDHGTILISSGGFPMLSGGLELTPN